VTGLELDISYSGLRGDDALIAPVIGGNPPLTTTQSNRIDWLGTVRGRLGWLVAPSILIYGTGGLAYGGVMASTTIVVPTPPGTCPAGSAFCSVGSQSATRAGWTVGAGLESAISSNWTVKLEYLYFNLGTLSYPVIVTSTGTFGGTTDMMASAKFDGQIVRVGLNYKFGQ
jgi:outer membrane immunogenic protein